MAELLIGPLIRHIGRTDATVWVEVDSPGEVTVLDAKTPTFTVEDHHYAIVAVEGLEPDSETPYEVALDGERIWPPADYDFPPPMIRTLPEAQRLTLLFGSCRCSAPHEPPFTHMRWWHPEGRGIDALRTYGLRMLDQPPALWPDAIVMLGDQLYADQPPPEVAKVVAPERVHPDGPVDVLEDFGEYTVGYRDAWTYPVVRWFLSNVPSSMMFDDHEINDKWKTSQAWLDEHRDTDWYHGRVIGGLMAYWIYQHLGNLSPEELKEDEVLQELLKVDDGSEIVHDLACREEDQSSHSRFSFERDLGPAKLVVVDSRAGRQLENGERRIMSEDEWGWVTKQIGDHDHPHLILGSSLPFLLPEGMHHIEGWSEAVTNGAWGKWACGLGEKVRIAANLDHWACFNESFQELEQLVIDVATGECGEPPATMVMLGGDVHHCFLSEVELPEEERARQRTAVWHAVCSGIRKELQASEQSVLRFGHTRSAAWIGRRLARSAKVKPPRLGWETVAGPSYRNQIGTIEIDGDVLALKLEKVTGNWKQPKLETIVEQRLS